MTRSQRCGLLVGMPQLVRRLGVSPPSVDEIERAIDEFQVARRKSTERTDGSLYATDGVDEWRFDEVVDLLRACREGARLDRLAVSYGPDRFQLVRSPDGLELTIVLPTVTEIRRVAGHLREGAPSGSAEAHRRVFLGHGRKPVWRVLSDHLRDHGFEVLTYENTSRPSQESMDVLRSLAASTSFAILVHTPEVRGADKRMYPGSNVVHETGYFQRELGEERVLIVHERGCDPVRNVAGSRTCSSLQTISRRSSVPSSPRCESPTKPGDAVQPTTLSWFVWRHV